MLIYFISRLYKVLSWEIIVINWIDIMNIIFKKRIIQRSYPNIHLHINYVRSFQEICIYFDQPRHPNGRQWPMTGYYLQHWRCNQDCTVWLVWFLVENLSKWANWRKTVIKVELSGYQDCIYGNRIRIWLPRNILRKVLSCSRSKINCRVAKFFQDMWKCYIGKYPFSRV